MSWRLLEEDGAAAAPGLAADELLARRVGEGASPPTLRLYTYRPHCALVGRFQRVEHEVDVERCAEHGFEVNRRPTGGGAILMGPDQLGIALALQGRGDGMHGGARALMQRFSEGIARGLETLGVTSAFRGKNDLEVGGRKVAGLGIYRDPSGGLLFHASLLVGLDVALMARVLRLPSADRERLDELATRTTTVREALGREVGMAEVRGRVAAGFARAFGAELVAGELAAEELAGVATLVREKYASTAWLRQESAVANLDGAATLRTAGGTLEARVALAGRTLAAVHVRGDFFESAAAIADLEARLRWHSSAPEALAATVAEWAATRPVETVEPEAFGRVILAAIAAATERAPSASPFAEKAPYGCFVTPGAGHV